MQRPIMTSGEEDALRRLLNRAKRDIDFAKWLEGQGISRERMLAEWMVVMRDSAKADVALMQAVNAYTGAFIDDIKAERAAKKPKSGETPTHDLTK